MVDESALVHVLKHEIAVVDPVQVTKTTKSVKICQKNYHRAFLICAAQLKRII